MTIKIKLTDRPVVKTSNPELYVNHTYHMKRAVKYTYNYAVLDDYVLQNWSSHSMRRMADDLNELLTRVEYRVQMLKSLGLIKGKLSAPRDNTRSKLTKEYKVLMTQAKAIKKQLEA